MALLNHPFTRLVLVVSALITSMIVSSPLLAGEEKREHSITIDSKPASQSLKFSLYLPDGYAASGNTKRYPVIYTTAGSRRFQLIKQQLDWLSHLDFGPIPQMILVSVPYVAVETTIEPKYVAASGVNSAITLQVLRDEVMPYLASNYRTQPFNILEGFSSSGNLAIYTLAHMPELFNAYIAISPALVLDKSNMIEHLGETLASAKFKHRSLYLSLGNFEQNVVPFEQLSTVLSKNANPGLSWHRENMAKDNYLTAVAVALPMALQRLFADRAPSDLAQFDAKGVSAITAYFAQLKQKYGFMPSPVTTLIDFSDRQLAQSNSAGAIATLQHLIRIKPETVYYHTLLGKTYQAAEQYPQATKILTQGLALAQAQKNDDAINYVTNLLAAIPSK